MKRSQINIFCVSLFFSPVSQATQLSTSYDIHVLGFTDSEHTRETDGYRYSNYNYLNEAGQVAGYANRYGAGGTNLGGSAWLYNGSSTVNIGFTDAEHTRITDGYRYSSTSQMNDVGQVAGSSYRYGADGASLGFSAWLYNGISTVNIGLTDAEHTRDTNGFRSSSISVLNEAGQVSGYSSRHGAGGTDLGFSAWLYNGSSTVNIGLTDAEHTRVTDGYRYTDIRHMNEVGHVAGIAYRYGVGGTDLGKSVWLYNSGGTVNIGLIDTEHTRVNDGYRESYIRQMNEAGQVAGDATRYGVGGAYQGKSAWLYSGGTTVNIGLTDQEHTDGSDGLRYSSISQMNEAGQVAGTSYRYSTRGGIQGQSAWLYGGGSTVNIGLTDAEHTRISDGYRSSSINQMNEAGQVAGDAERFGANGWSLGKSAWLYSGDSTVSIGLTDAEHTRDTDGLQANSINRMNEAGQVTGYASRYGVGGKYLGRSAWLYSDGSAVEVGLTDAERTRDTDGYRDSTISKLNELGQVAGVANRYGAGGTNLGQSAWFYDLTLDEAMSLDLSVRSDGYASSRVDYLGDDGLLLGSYTLYDTDDTMLGSRAFAFTLEDGAVDLGGLVDGGLNDAGWASLASAYLSNDLRMIVGYGLLSDMTNGQMAFVMTPQAVPVPAAAWLFGSGLLGLVGVARRNNAA